VAPFFVPDHLPFLPPASENNEQQLKTGGKKHLINSIFSGKTRMKVIQTLFYYWPTTAIFVKITR